MKKVALNDAVQSKIDIDLNKFFAQNVKYHKDSVIVN